MDATRDTPSRRGYVHLSAAWYSASAIEAAHGEYVDEIMLVSTDPDGNTDGEIAIRWTDRVLRDGHPVPYLHAFGDSWKALATMGDVLTALGHLNSESRTPEDVVAIAKKCGFIDTTVRVRREAPGGLLDLESESRTAPRG